MRTRFNDPTLGDSCRGNGGGRSIRSAVTGGGGAPIQVPITDVTFIYYENPNTNYGSFLPLDCSFCTGFLCMGMLKTDLSAYNGRTVLAATLNIYQWAGGVTKDFKVWEVWRTWAELEATYIDRLTGVAWQIQGCEGAGDRNPNPCDTIPVDAIGWYSWDVSVPVTAWLGSVRTNYGLRLWCTDKTAAHNQWWSDDAGNPALRPYFELTLA